MMVHGFITMPNLSLTRSFKRDMGFDVGCREKRERTKYVYIAEKSIMECRAVGCVANSTWNALRRSHKNT